MLKTAAVFEVLPKKVLRLLPYDVTWVAKPLVSSEWDLSRKERPFVLRKSYIIPSRQQQLSQRFQKMPNNVFSCQHHQKWPNYDVHSKHHFFMPKQL